LAQQADFAHQAFAAITNTLHNHQASHMKRTTTKAGGNTQRSPKPEWFYKPPATPSQTHKHDGRDWHWCPKCGRDQQGKGVCTHLPSEHKDSYIRKCKGDNDTATNKQLKTPTTPIQSVSQMTHANIAQLAQAHAQLTALLATAQLGSLPLPSAHHAEHPAPYSDNGPTADLLDIDQW